MAHQVAARPRAAACRPGSATTCCLKREDLQAVFSFKLRGAHNKIAQTPPEKLANGVICSSAGNHAQGVALAARKRGLRAVIVMPKTTPSIKVDAVVALGGEAVLHGEDYDDANAHARELEAAQGLMLRASVQRPRRHRRAGRPSAPSSSASGRGVPDAVFVPVGGGGLISGIGALPQARCPDIKIDRRRARRCGEHVSSRSRRAASSRSTASAPLPTASPCGALARRRFALRSEVVDEIILVNTDEICAAIKDIFDDVRVVVEPAGALAVAGMKRCGAARPAPAAGRFVAVNSGANMNFARLRLVAERAELGEATRGAAGRRDPGAPRRVPASSARRIGRPQHHRVQLSLTRRAPRRASSSASRCSADAPRKAELVAATGEAGLSDRARLSDNEMAKLHVRHLVGGRAPACERTACTASSFPSGPARC